MLLHKQLNTKQSTLKKSDLDMMKNIGIIFIMTRLVALFLNFIDDGYLGVIVSGGGLAIFAIGILIFSKNNPNFKTGYIVSMIFLITIVVDLLTIYVDSQFLLDDFNPQNIQQFIAYVQPLIAQGYIIVGLLLISGTLIFIAAYLFTNWFNPIFGRYEETKHYYYYGILMAIGQIATAFGLLMMINTFSEIVNYGRITQVHVNQLDSGSSILGISGLLALAATITEIVASFKIYSIIEKNSSRSSSFLEYTGNIPTSQHSTYQSSYNPAYEPNTRDENTNSVSSNYCGYCGSKRDPNARFCINCGFKW